MPKPICIFLISAALVLMNVVVAGAQVNSTNRTTIPAPSRVSDQPISNFYGGYEIGVGDILDIHVNDEEEISGRYQVDESGKVKITLLSSPLDAAGTTTFDLASRISTELKNQQILRDPSTTVLILRAVTQNVSVLGAVVRPGVYPVEKPSTLLDVISQAGGLGPNAGNSLTIFHGSETPGSTATAATAAAKGTPVATVNITDLLAAKDPSLNRPVHSGDVITVNTAPVVFVVGSVTRPGAFAIQDRRSEMTVLQAVAMAEGPMPNASLGKTIIIRQSTSSKERQEIPVDLKKVMRGKDTDQVLEANDILFVPQSGLKAGARRLGEMGTQAAVGVASYAVIF
ncbi:MAG TPA: SLBB domain-containing protein [Candidatus Saccharimonadales bacterium]|jgi:polysaccharide export outer membrane protein|nr:SLBB domain-containing protein [Candidatus Saccharimonadales bacterium]